jgi:hypothetical protein
VGLAKPALVGRSEWFRLTLHITSVINVAALAFFVFTLGSTRIQPERHVLPIGYRGWVYVVFDSPNGVTTEYDGRRRVYRIPGDGVLVTQARPNDGWSVPGDVEYVDALGRPIATRHRASGWAVRGGCRLNYISYWTGALPMADVSDVPDNVVNAACWWSKQEPK